MPPGVPAAAPPPSPVSTAPTCFIFLSTHAPAIAMTPAVRSPSPLLPVWQLLAAGSFFHVTLSDSGLVGPFWTGGLPDWRFGVVVPGVVVALPPPAPPQV